MEYSFPRYLLAKQTVDDRALNRSVLEALKGRLPRRRIRAIEIGAGMGNMLTRLLSWNVITQADYIHEDSMAENIAFASRWIPEWAVHAGMQTQRSGESELRVFDSQRDIRLTLQQQDVFDFIRSRPTPADLLIAHAFLDLLRLPQSLPEVLSLTTNLAWFTINFDGLTAFEPTIDPALDDQVVRLYHRTMDDRPSGGDSRSGRHLLEELPHFGARVLEAGSSDWIVFPQHGSYPADEAYFLEVILHFFEQALAGNPELDSRAFASWLDTRRAQIARGELIYLAHQLDLAVEV